MIIYPAIDVMDGKCVRLYQGDFAQQTAYEVSPAQTAQRYKAQGAQWLHLVDLDGAKDTNQRQIQLITEIIKQSKLQVQTGGGVRTPEDVQALLNAGASRVAIGSLAIKKPDLTVEILKRFGADKICLAADVKIQNGKHSLAVSGWQEQSDMTLNAFIQNYLDVGLKHLLCTDISRDGTMEGCNFALYEEIQTTFPKIEIQASGGVSSLEDVRKLKAAGVIIGKALYEGAFSLPEALEAASC